VVWCGCQNTRRTQEQIALALGVKAGRVDVRMRRAGGAFGGKRRSGGGGRTFSPLPSLFFILACCEEGPFESWPVAKCGECVPWDACIYTYMYMYVYIYVVFYIMYAGS
jgi:hypothetical protein